MKLKLSIFFLLSIFSLNGFAQHYQGSLWLNCHANYSAWKTFLADVTGDGRADIVCWLAATTQARVFTAKSETNGFNLPVTWINDPGNYTGWKVFMADVNGDGRADIVAWCAPHEKAVVFRARDEADGFFNGSVWYDGPGDYGGHLHLPVLADVSGDERADIVDWNATDERAVVWRAKEDGNGYGRADIIVWDAVHGKAQVWVVK